MPTLGDENIGGLDIPMNDALGVGRVERVRDLDAQVEQLFEVERIASNGVFERLAFEQLHGDEWFLISFIHCIDGADVRVVERGSGQGFALEAFASSRDPLAMSSGRNFSATRRCSFRSSAS